MMKLEAKLVDAASVGGGKAIVLHDEQGNALPGQLGSTVTCHVGECSTVTVTFEVDGENVVLK